MDILHYLSKNIIARLALCSNRDIGQQQIDVMIYGMDCLLNSSLTVLILLIWGLSTGDIAVTIFWFVSFVLYRHALKGWHAPGNLSCILISSITGITASFFSFYATHFPLIMRITISIPFVFLYLIKNINSASVYKNKKSLFFSRLASSMAVISSIDFICFPLKLFSAIFYAMLLTVLFSLIPHKVITGLEAAHGYSFNHM